MSMLYERCSFCRVRGEHETRETACDGCHGVGFVPIGLTRAGLDALARSSPDRAQIMRAVLREIEDSPAFFDETQSIVNKARAVLDAVGR